MARHTRIYVGPYAAWLVPQDAWLAAWECRDVPLSEEVLDGAALSIAGIDWGGAVIGDRPHLGFYGLAREARPGAPQRAMLIETGRGGYFDPFPQPTDWTGLDQGAEVRWFRSAFAAEIERACRLFGGPPEFRWGLLVEQLP